jgi:tetratricopeptide (TPR) repeat protein
MKSKSIHARFFRNQMAILTMLFGTSCFAKASSPEQATAPSLELAKKLEQESATVELQVTLVGNLEDFSIASGGASRPADGLAQQTQVEAAAAAYREALKNDLDNPELHFDLSLALAKLSDAHGARLELETAIRLDRNLAKAHNQLGIRHMKDNEKAKAERDFEAAISIDSHCAEAKNNLGVLYAWSGKGLEAIDLFRLAIQERQNYAPAHVNLGFVLAGEGKYAEAEKEIRNALHGSPKNVSAYSALGMIAAKLGRGEEAIEILQKVLQVQPDSAFAHLNLGAALAAEGFDLLGALKQFSEAIRLDSGSAAAHYSKGRVLYELDRFEESRVELDTACRLQPDYPEALYLLAQVEKKTGNVQRSVELLDHLVTLEPSNSDAQLLMGRNLLILGNMEEAIHHMQIAVGVSPNNEDALYSLAQALGRVGRPEAKVFLERFQNLKQQREVNDRIQKLGSYGLEAANARDWPQAVADFKEAIELCEQCTSSADLHLNLGLIYILKGDLEEGKRELETVLRIKPNNADARKALQSLSNKESTPD